MPQAPNRLLAVLYTVVGLVAVLWLSFSVPPYENPDEGTQFMRAEQVSRLTLIGYRLAPTIAGGVVDGSIIKTIRPYLPVRRSPTTHPTAEMHAAAGAFRWGEGDALGGFSNTAVYAPFLYAPASLTIAAGKAADLSVVTTLKVARATAGVVAVLIAAGAILLAGTAAPLLFTLLSLPMVLSQMASVSQDGMMFATAALAAALLVAPLRDGGRVSAGRFALGCLCIALFAMGRPPYVAMALLLLLPNGLGWRIRLAGFGLVLASVVGWTVLAKIVAVVIFRFDIQPGEVIDPAQQLELILFHPLRYLHVMFLSLYLFGSAFADQIVGMLAWMDLILPRPYYQAAWIVVLVAWLLSHVPEGAARARLHLGLVTAVAMAAGMTGIFMAQFLVWTPVGSPVVHGVQGRYFIPLILCGIGLLPLSLPYAPWPTVRLHRAGFVLVACFPVVSLAVMIHAYSVRYGL